MKSTNKILLVVLLVLLSAFVLTKVFRSPALESNLDTEAFQLDTARIARMVFHLPSESPITLEKDDSTWTVRQADKTAGVREFERRNLFRSILNLKPERMVTRKEEKWSDYQVGDTTAVRVEVYDKNNDKIKSWFVGTESGGLTYVRPADKPVVYAVEGNLRTRFGSGFNGWRDRTFLRINRALVNKLTFQYPADSGFVLEKRGRHWLINDQKADSAKVESYLSEIEFKELREFVDAPAGEPHVMVTVEGDPDGQTVIRAWKDTDEEWIFTSTLQADAYFSDRSLATDLFPGRAWFAPAE